MKLRGRELYIIAAIVAVVVGAAWYFFFFNPISDEIASLDEEIAAKQNERASVQSEVQRLEALKKTSPQAEADLVRLRKLLPAETAMPSFIIELTQTAKASGLKWAVGGARARHSWCALQPRAYRLVFVGEYFDVEDFLYRLENYVDYRNGKFVVTGRMFTVKSMDITLEGDATAGYVLNVVGMTVHGFMWTPQGTAPGVVAEE